MNPMWLSRLFHLVYPILDYLPTKLQVKIMSVGRQKFMHALESYSPKEVFAPNEKFSTVLWGIKFRSPIMNSAGMFKNGECYDLVAKLGAGGYIGGTSTVNPRVGNLKDGIKLPFITLPNSKTSVNWLGLPNLGDSILSSRIITNSKVDGCPIGWSVMRSPDYDEELGLKLLIDSLWKYHDNNQIDFIEINESCPNIKSGGGNIKNRLRVIAQDFLSKRTRILPVVVKLSNDITFDVLEDILHEMFQLGYDGINLGNTSVNYESIKKELLPEDIPLFEQFTKSFGGGVSGYPLKSLSLELCKKAVQVVNAANLDREFHVIRSGGVEGLADVDESLNIGVSLVQWYTGFFTTLNCYGDDVYRETFNCDTI